jgi:hypothetical protein
LACANAGRAGVPFERRCNCCCARVLVLRCAVTGLVNEFRVSNVIPNALEVVLSPKKTEDLARYLRTYPRFPLPTDLLLDLVLHPTLLLSRQGYGVIFDESDFEHSPWKRSFEDLINLGALKATRGRYPSRQEMLNLMRRTDLHRSEEGADLAFFFLDSRDRGAPLLCRNHELDVFDSNSALWIEAMTGRKDAAPRADPQRDKVAFWMLQAQIPSAFVANAPSVAAQAVDGASLDQVWMSPADLVTALKGRDPKGLAQLQTEISDLAATAARQVDVFKSLAAARHERELRRQKGETFFKRGQRTVEVGGMLLDWLVCPGMSIGASALNYVADRIAGRRVEKQMTGSYHWLLMTEAIEAALSKAR